MQEYEAKYWHFRDDLIVCDLCPRGCQLKEGQEGFCRSRGRRGNRMMLYTYNTASGFAIDPIEKKPLHHFLPTSEVLSFGTMGCNLDCKFCQNHNITKTAQPRARLQTTCSDGIVAMALSRGCQSIAFTYNDPITFLEFATDTAICAKEHGIRTVAVTNGYLNSIPRRDFFTTIDAANVDLKAFNDSFYRRLTGSRLDPVLETLKYIHYETKAWLEITTLLIPDENDSQAEIEAMTQWVCTELGPNVPWHFSAFHPAWKMRNKNPTPIATLKMARKIAQEGGINYVFIGNVHDSQASSSYCHNCRKLLIERDWYSVQISGLNAHGQCNHCATKIPGVFA